MNLSHVFMCSFVHIYNFAFKPVHLQHETGGRTLRTPC
jgi:hypothetical protein